MPWPQVCWDVSPPLDAGSHSESQFYRTVARHALRLAFHPELVQDSGPSHFGYPGCPKIFAKLARDLPSAPRGGNFRDFTYC